MPTCCAAAGKATCPPRGRHSAPRARLPRPTHRVPTTQRRLARSVRQAGTSTQVPTVALRAGQARCPSRADSQGAHHVTRATRPTRSAPAATHVRRGSTAQIEGRYRVPGVPSPLCLNLCLSLSLSLSLFSLSSYSSHSSCSSFPHLSLIFPSSPSRHISHGDEPNE